MDIGMIVVHSSDAFGGGHDTERRDVACTRRLDPVDGPRQGSTRGEHRFEDEHRRVRQVGEPCVVLLRERGLLVPLHARETDLAVWDHFEDRVKHAETGTKYRNGYNVVHAVSDGLLHRCLDFDLREWETLRGFEHEAVCQPARCSPKRFGRCAAVAQDGEIVPGERMIDHGEIHTPSFADHVSRGEP